VSTDEKSAIQVEDDESSVQQNDPKNKHTTEGGKQEGNGEGKKKEKTNTTSQPTERRRNQGGRRETMEKIWPLDPQRALVLIRTCRLGQKVGKPTTFGRGCPTGRSVDSCSHPSEESVHVPRLPKKATKRSTSFQTRRKGKCAQGGEAHRGAGVSSSKKEQGKRKEERENEFEPRQH